MPAHQTDSFFDCPLPPLSKRRQNTTSLDVLQEIFGFTTFRREQEPIIDHLVKGEDALVLMTTGGGKSLCYQVPALVRPGMGLVISPLIPLMKDQVDTLRKKGIRATALTHLLSDGERAEAEKAIKEGSIDVLYVSPERLQSTSFKKLLRTCDISLIAIDEAHVMSRWGHDFREAYLKISDFLASYPHTPKVALTATADPETQKDILEKACLRKPMIFRTSFNRENLYIEVRRRIEPIRDCLKIIKAHADEDGIIFCPTRKSVEDMTKALSQHDIKCIGYHAGMSKAERSEAQKRFMEETGIVAVATIAFGMGIDKANIRYVIHSSVPATAEAYYQEIGRAGRDGLPSKAYMLFKNSDILNAQRNLVGRLEEEIDPEKRGFVLRDMMKLQDIHGFIESPECRRKTLLNLFGEKFPGHCNQCDRCQHPISCEDCTEEVRLIVKTIASTGQKYGSGYLVEVLQGLKTSKVAENEHEHLSMFGKGKDLLKKDWLSIIRQTRAAGLIKPTEQAGWALEEAAWPFLRGQGSLRLNLLRAKQQRQRSVHPEGVSIQASKMSMPESSIRWTEELLALKNRLPMQDRALLGKEGLSRIISLLPRTKDECRKALNGAGAFGEDIVDEIVALVKKHKGPNLKSDPLDVITF